MNASPAAVIDPQTHYRRWQNRILWTVWVTYGSFYFCRANISAAVPGMQEELDLDPLQVGMILGWMKICYAAGQFINGQLGDRLGAKRMLLLGMLASVALNFLFGLGTAVWFLVFVWAANGYFQAMGWPACVKVMSAWFPAAGRGKAMGFIGVGYQLGAALVLVLSGRLIGATGNWRMAFYVPAAIFMLSAIHTQLRLRNTPEDAGLPPLETVVESPREHLPLRETLRFVLTSPRLWVVALGLFGLDLARYGFLDWAPAHLKEVQHTGIESAVLKAAILPLGGALGAYVSGWLTDRYFQSRRAPVTCVMLALLGVVTLAYDAVVQTSFLATVVLLGLIGFMIYGPQVILVGTMAADFSTRRTAASAAGFIDFVGYLGAFASNWLTGYLLKHYDWHAAVTAWAVVSFATAALIATLWNAKPVSEETAKAAGAAGSDTPHTGQESA